MRSVNNIGLASLLGLLGGPAFCQELQGAQNGWDASLFKYERTTPVVEETTPTAAQADVWRRPGVLAKSRAALKAERDGSAADDGGHGRRSAAVPGCDRG